MHNNVTIKGKENGLEITLSDRSTYPVLREELLEKLEQNISFFKGSQTQVVIRGKVLSSAQQKELKRVFSMDYGIEDVLYGEQPEILEEVEDTIEMTSRPGPALGHRQETTYRELELVSSEYFDAESVFINGTVRSGQRIEAEGDIVIIGDVNPGAEVMAGGSISVFGKLRGLVHAGASGRKDVCIAAVRMCTMQLRISGRVITFPNNHAEESTEPEVAEIIGGRVVIRPISAR